MKVSTQCSRTRMIESFLNSSWISINIWSRKKIKYHSIFILGSHTQLPKSIMLGLLEQIENLQLLLLFVRLPICSCVPPLKLYCSCTHVGGGDGGGFNMENFIDLLFSMCHTFSKKVICTWPDRLHHVAFRTAYHNQVGKLCPSV